MVYLNGYVDDIRVERPVIGPITEAIQAHEIRVRRVFERPVTVQYQCSVTRRAYQVRLKNITFHVAVVREDAWNIDAKAVIFQDGKTLD